MEVVVTTGAIYRANLQSNRHQQQTNTQFFTCRMPFVSPNQQCQGSEGKMSHCMDLLTPSSPGGLPTLCLTTISSWLPWGRVAMPLISHLMPEPPLPLKCWSLCLRSLLTSLANCLPINWRQHTLTTLDKEPVKQRHISNSNPQRFFSDRAL